MRRHLQLGFCTALLTVGLLAGGCDSSEEGSDTPPEGFTLVGAWEVTAIEGAPGSVDGSNSTWTLRENGTYSWFLDLPPFDLSGGGNYSLDGGTLTVSGVVANTVLSEATDGRVALSFGSNTFSFRDDDGDRWTYRRAE
ncbi:MAG: hypothetical protein ABJF88_13365 [Rhodothermales bacterium]